MNKIAFLIFLIIILFAPNGAGASHYVNERFTPYKGTSVLASDATGRYTDQYMFWRTGSMTAFDSANKIYEHETVFYPTTRWGTDSLSWQTNLPDPYLDTQALDTSGEENFTVGSFDPDSIVPEILYTAKIYLINGDGTQLAYYKIQSQIADSVCEAGPWCVPSIDQTSRLIPFKIPNPSFFAPENRNFRHEWENNGNTSLADPLSLGDWGSGVINSSTDQDYFKFNVPSQRTVNFFLRMPSGKDYDVTIYNSTGGYVTAGIASGSSDEIFSSSLPTGTYYAVVKSYSGTDTTNNYQFVAY